MNKKKLLKLSVGWAILIVVLVAIYLPLLLIIVYSFSSAKSVGADFGKFTFALYGKLFDNQELLTATKNSLLIGLLSALFATVLGTTAAIGIHYMRRRPRAVRARSCARCRFPSAARSAPPPSRAAGP